MSEYNIRTDWLKYRFRSGNTFTMRPYEGDGNIRGYFEPYKPSREDLDEFDNSLDLLIRQQGIGASVHVIAYVRDAARGAERPRWCLDLNSTNRDEIYQPFQRINISLDPQL